jgi:hypothetical protein
MAAEAHAEGVSRRGMVKGLAVAAGVVGVGAAGRATADVGRGTLELGETQVRLEGRHWRTMMVGSAAAAMPDAGSVPSTMGELLRDGKLLGKFSSASVPGSMGRFVLHSFDLEDGMLLGMGSGPLAEGVFAVIGGTGTYTGATGSYTARQRPLQAGGDGTADFVLDLTARKG